MPGQGRGKTVVKLEEKKMTKKPKVKQCFVEKQVKKGGSSSWRLGGVFLGVWL